MPRGEEEIRKELGAAVIDYQASAPTAAGPELQGKSDRVKALQRELSATLTAGAKACPRCGNRPIGLRHIHIIVATNRRVYTYEVGCPCGPVKDSSGNIIATLRSQGPSVADTVSAWNREAYIPPKDSITSPVSGDAADKPSLLKRLFG